MANNEYVLKNPNRLELSYEDIQKMTVNEYGEAKKQYYRTNYFLGSFPTDYEDAFDVIHNGDDIFGRDVSLYKTAGADGLALVDIANKTYEILISKAQYDSTTEDTTYDVKLNNEIVDSDIVMIIRANTNVLKPYFAIYTPDTVAPSEPTTDDIVFVLTLQLTELPFSNLNFVLNSNIYIGLSTVVYNYSGNYIRYISQSCLNRLFQENCLISISPYNKPYQTSFVMSVYNDIYVQKDEIIQKHPNNSDIKNAQQIGIISIDLPALHGNISDDEIVNSCIFPGYALYNKKITELMPIFFALDNNTGQYVMTYGEYSNKNIYNIGSYQYLPGNVYTDQSLVLNNYYSQF